VLIIEEKGLGQISDKGLLKEITDKVIDDNPKSVEDYRNGKEKALKFLMGRVMAQTKGQADPVKVNELLIRRLNNEDEK
ncbi:MAG: Asp-tRNA(Asn)/Glu-tRNA(Gln) amidotransferase GatCAB subunit B, partial [Candidatus Omnitrophica bacterium]|nr:Asp-tRNA(Asn)/Glu-tRNA(Gln) amidotransferase GatCAB subunit B [Candidatus Omnitrophota bacterium]